MQSSIHHCECISFLIKIDKRLAIRLFKKLGYSYNMNLSAIIYGFICYMFSKDYLLYLKMAHCFLKYLVIILSSDKNWLQIMDLLLSLHAVPCTIKLFFLDRYSNANIFHCAIMNAQNMRKEVDYLSTNNIKYLGRNMYLPRVARLLL